MKKNLLLYIITLFCVSNASFGQLDVYRKKLKEYRYTKYLDSATFYFKKGLPIALKNKDSINIFMLYKNMGDAFEHHQQLDKTLSQYAICDRFIPNNNLKLKSFLLNDMAYTYTLLRDFDLATKLTLKSLKIAENSKDQKEIAINSISVAEGFSNLNLNTQAEGYFKKGIAIAMQIKSDYLTEYSHRYYAAHLLKTKNSNLAFQNLTVSTKFANKIKDSISLAFNYQQLSIYYWQKKQLNQCFDFGKKAEKIWEQRAENRDLASICAQLGKYYLTLKQLDQAGFYLKKAKQFLTTDLYLSQDLYSDLSSLYNQTNQKKLAFDYLLKAKTTIEKIKESESKSKVASLRIQFETDQKEAEIQQQKLKNQQSLLREAKSNSQFWILMVFLVFLTLAVIFAIFYLKKIKIKNQLLKESNTTLEKLSLQKKILLQEIHHRVKNNLTTLKSLFYLQSKSSENQDLKNVLKECELRIDSMALIHQSLYENGESDNVDFNTFIDNLFDSLESTFKKSDCDVKIKVTLNDVEIKLSKGIYLGLILNELATNSYKYAFLNQTEGSICVTISKNKNKIQVLYSDNGVGISDFETQKQGFGLKLIAILTQQIDAKLKYTFKKGLSQFKITFDEI